MFLATTLTWAVLNQAVLPGSKLSIASAKEKACFIVVAEVLDGDRAILNPQERSFQLWTALKISQVLKGAVNDEELNKHPLAMRASRNERLPRVGEELIFFIPERHGLFPISKVLPKTAANLAAIAAAKPEPRPDPSREGRSHLIMLGADRMEIKPGPPIPYQGTKIVPNKEAAGDILDLQNGFAAQLARNDPDPASRAAHFEWMYRNECFRRYGARRIGWHGYITAMESRREGGWLVRVLIRPHLASPFRLPIVDSVEETYEYSGGRIRLLESNAAVAKPNKQGFPGAI